MATARFYLRKSEGNIYNTASVINPQGEVVTRYRKNVSILSL
jgi:predicted amidohydrolase